MGENQIPAVSERLFRHENDLTIFKEGDVIPLALLAKQERNAAHADRSGRYLFRYLAPCCTAISWRQFAAVAIVS